MNLRLICSLSLFAALIPLEAHADHSFADVARQVNPKLVKVFGAGGFRGVTDYCTGVLISPDGYILTVYSPALDTTDIRVHLYDGTRHEAVLVMAEPQLDVALLQIRSEKFKISDLPFFDLSKESPKVEPGDWVLGFSNLFKIADRDEPMSVQRGVIAAIAPLAARRGIHEASYKGTVYVVDAITNNPGSHGGVLTTRKGELIGLIGKELKNTLSETWVNYAMPIKDLTKFVAEAKAGKWKRLDKSKEEEIVDKGAYHGITLLPDILERTPPYIEMVEPGSPAAKAGLKTNDLIVFLRMPQPGEDKQMEEKVILSCKAFKETLAPLEPGTKLQVIIRRGQQLLSMDLALGAPLKTVEK